jgi:hypothetical protein
MAKKDASPAAPDGARRASGGAAGDGAADRGRFSSRRKLEAVLRLLRSEALDAVSRELRVAGATLGRRREQLLAGGQANLKSREPDELDEEILRLRVRVGEITMSNELLLECARRGGRLPSSRCPTDLRRFREPLLLDRSRCILAPELRRTATRGG